MLGDNIRVLRKQKGYSQETLAQELNVVRQTVSKWEKGYSVPDAEMLERLANLFEVPVSALLGSNIPENADPSDVSEVVKQLAILNEQLAKRSRDRRRMLKIVLISIAAAIALIIIILVLSFGALSVDMSSVETFASSELIG